jgi:hypothetical protein
VAFNAAELKLYPGARIDEKATKEQMESLDVTAIIVSDKR